MELGKPPYGVTKLQDSKPDQNQSLEVLRAELRLEMDKMRRSLTGGEQAFLESLVLNGDEIEVQVARKRLSDISIFLPHEEEKVDIDVRDDEVAGGSISIERGTFVEIDNGAALDPAITTAPPRQSLLRRSSIKVVQALHLRKSSTVHCEIWKAHENGVAVTEIGASNLAARRASSAGEKIPSTSGSSVLRTEKVSSSIFREIRTSTIEKQQETLFNTIDAVSPTMPKSIMRPTDFPSPLSLVPVKSSGFRKSVSFNKNEPRQRSQSFSKASPQVSRNPLRREVSDLSLGSESGGSHLFSSTSTLEMPAPVQEGRATRSDSVSSFPSLRQSHTLQSESVASIPSLHRAAPLGSPSVASTAPSNASDPTQHSPETTQVHHKPILLRMASRNIDLGEGIEVTELDEDAETVNKARLYARMLSTGDVSTASSWDEAANRESIFREFRRTLSDDENLTSYFLGSASKCMLSTFWIDLLFS